MPTRAATAGFPLHLSEVIEQDLAVLAPDDAAGPDGQPPWDFAADQVRQDTLPGLLARLRKPGDEVCARLRDHLSPAFRELLERQGEEDGATEEALRDGLVEELNHCLREDYLSTVSGGGYLGGLLSAWIHRHPRGLAGVSDELAGRQVVVRRPVRRHQPHRLERPRGPGAGARARTAAGEAARDPVPDPRRHDRQRPPRLVARQRVAVRELPHARPAHHRCDL